MRAGKNLPNGRNTLLATAKKPGERRGGRNHRANTSLLTHSLGSAARFEGFKHMPGLVELATKGSVKISIRKVEMKEENWLI